MEKRLHRSCSPTSHFHSVISFPSDARQASCKELLHGKRTSLILADVTEYTLARPPPTECRGFWCISSPNGATAREPLWLPPTRSLTSVIFRLVKVTGGSTTSTRRCRARTI